MSDRIGKSVLRTLLDALERTTGSKILFSEAQLDLNAQQIVLTHSIHHAKRDVAKALKNGCFTYYFDAIQLKRLKGFPKWSALFSDGATLQRVVESAASTLDPTTVPGLDRDIHTSSDSTSHPSVVTHTQLALPDRIIIALRIKTDEKIMRWNLVAFQVLRDVSLFLSEKIAKRLDILFVKANEIMIAEDPTWKKDDHEAKTDAQDEKFANILYRLADLDKHPAYAQGIGKRCCAGEPDEPLLDNDGNTFDPRRTFLSKLGFARRSDDRRARCVTSWVDYGRLFIGRMQAPHFDHDRTDDPETLGQLMNNMPTVVYSLMICFRTRTARDLLRSSSFARSSVKFGTACAIWRS
jgi:hypothetical protein